MGGQITGYRGDMDELVESSLKQAALWEEVKDRPGERARALRRSAAASLHRAHTWRWSPR